MPARYASAGLTHQGHVRDHNEDAFLDAPAQNLWVVADGMGGHSAGEFASGLIVDALGKSSSAPDLNEQLETAEKHLWAVNETLCAEAKARGVTMIGATTVLMLGGRDFVLCGWAGDSRIYRLHAGKLSRVTHDHSSVQEMMDAGSLTEAQARTHPQASAITRAVGGEANLFLDWRLAEVGSGTRFLLCSDGVTKELEDAQIEALLKKPSDAKAAAAEIVQAALDHGGRDNTTAIVVDVQVTP